MTSTNWYERPQGEALTLRKTPRLASWNKATDPDQVRLKDYLDDTADLLRSATTTVRGPWSLRMDVGLPAGTDLTNMADLDNYAYPLASRLRTNQLVSVWCTKGHSVTSHVLVAAARPTAPPPELWSARTTASSQTSGYKEQVRSGVAEAAEILTGPVQLEIAFVVGPRRNWLNLWKPTIDALDPLLGRTRPDRSWHPKDGRITTLGLHLKTDPALGNDVVVSISATPAA